MKKRRILITGGALLLSAFAACEPYLSLDEALTGKDCAAAEPRCALGYTCNDALKCVSTETGTSPVRPLPGEEGGAGAGSAEAAAGAGAEPAGSAGASGSEPALNAGAGGMPGSAGAGSTEPGGSDPGEPPAVADAGCTAVTLHRDLDGDTYGSDSEEARIEGCPPMPGFVTRGGDCLDAEPTPENRANFVNPGVLDYFGVGYPTPTGESFDYDCSEREDVDPLQASRTELPDCSQATYPACFSLSGYVPTERAGSSVNAICGSEVVMLCNPGPDECFLQSLPTTNPLRCR